MVFTKLITKYNKHNFGVYEWLLVRLSAIFIMIYIALIFSYVFFSHNFSYEKWYYFFNNKCIKTFNTFILLSILMHSWFGIKHILEDYIKLFLLKKIVVGLTIVILCVYLLMGMVIIWDI